MSKPIRTLPYQYFSSDEHQIFLEEADKYPKTIILTDNQRKELSDIANGIKKPFIKITCAGQNSNSFKIFPNNSEGNWSTIVDELGGLVYGLYNDKITLEIVYMTDGEYEKIAEFQGW